MNDDRSDSSSVGASDGRPSAASERGADRGPTRTDRRRYLGLVGAAAASLAGCLGPDSDDGDGPADDQPGASDGGVSDDPPDAETDGEQFGSRHGIEFDRVLDAVDDLGLDPSGETDIVDDLETALSDDGTMVLFPEGEYRVGSSISLDAERIGIVGLADVRFVPTFGFDGLLFNGDGERLDDVIVENVDVDIRKPSTTAGIRLNCRERFHVEDVEYVGRGNINDGGQVSAFLLAIRDEDGRGILRDVVAKKGSRIDGYEGGNGRIGVWVGWSNKGTVRIQNCDFREFGNNGIYGSRTPGNVEIVDSYFLNNNVCGARIGGAGSYVENCTVEIDLDRYTGPPVDTSTEFDTRAIVVEQGVQLEGADPIPAGAEIRGCTLHARRSPRSQSVIEQAPQARSLLVRDTEIRCDIDETPAVRRAPVGSIPYRPDRRVPPPPHWTRLENVTIDGSAAGGAAVDLRLAPGSAVRNCDIACPGADRDGIFLDHSPESEVAGSTIRADGHPIVVAADPTIPSDRQVVCLGLETVLDRIGSTETLVELTANPAVFRTLVRNTHTNTICLGLGSVVSTASFIASLRDADSLEIGIDALENGTPVGSLLNR